MEKKRNAALLLGVVLPLILLLWPFAQWGAEFSLVLRIIPALCAQLLACRSGKGDLLKLFPLLLTGAFALWGMYLYLTSDAWAQASFVGLLADYISPFLACGLVYGSTSLKTK